MADKSEVVLFRTEYAVDAELAEECSRKARATLRRNAERRCDAPDCPRDPPESDEVQQS
jgi:hypothetical protein